MLRIEYIEMICHNCSAFHAFSTSDIEEIADAETGELLDVDQVASRLAIKKPPAPDVEGQESKGCSFMLLLFTCITTAASVTCLPPQPAPNAPVCKAMAREFRDTATRAGGKPIARCVEITADGQSEDLPDYRKP